MIVCSNPKCRTAAGCVCHMVTIPAERLVPSHLLERIVAAACRLGPNLIASWPPPDRHNDIMRKLDAVGHGLGLISPEEQGFLTSKGRFVGRIEAWDIAKFQGQIIGKPPCPGTLYSEDLW